MKTMFDVGDKVLVLATITKIGIDDEGIKYKLNLMDGENPWGDMVNFAVPEHSIKGKAE